MSKEFDPNIMGEKIIKVIKTIYDPEIPVDIYELGLIYDIMINENFDVKIIMTLTSPNCPVISVQKHSYFMITQFFAIF